ncbi:hypothetical protein FEM48_Zijuj04G0084600 [Ziziphus jujuba var. spinosa]|uniref:Uncharacterized protein n=1 Tax=Ziziphus jujuba var. spinosa TaxID=714518 RepID=A0A978VIU4_ZIZJJ|nr:hypothetical protein FEM48_Zijuj04G0084600 [Ziziphus jujuba var. spinosa]
MSSGNHVDISVSTQAPIKLILDNYVTWCHNGIPCLLDINGENICPSAKPSCTFRIRQNHLLPRSLIAFLSPSLIKIVPSIDSSRDTWTKLATTYVKPSHDCIMGLRETLSKLTKGFHYISDFHNARTCRKLLATVPWL